MSDDKPNPARIAFELDLHRSDTDEEVRFGAPDLKYAHLQILENLDYDKWIPRVKLRQETAFRRKKLKKHIEYLKTHDYVEERSEGRKKLYRRISQ